MKYRGQLYIIFFPLYKHYFSEMKNLKVREINCFENNQCSSISGVDSFIHRAEHVNMQARTRQLNDSYELFPSYDRGEKKRKDRVGRYGTCQ